METFKKELAARRVVLYSDNKGRLRKKVVAAPMGATYMAGAEHATARGSARALDHNQIIHEIWTLCLRQKIDLWIERVPSKDNISDSPSRGEHKILHDLGAKWKAPVWGKLVIDSNMR